MTAWHRLAAVIVVVLSGGVACQSGGVAGNSPEVIVGVATSVAPTVRSSLFDGALAEAGIDAEMTAAASSVIAQQVERGAPISVVVSADERYVADLERDGLVVERDRLVGNEIVLAVPAGAGAVESVSDLGDPDVRLGVCDLTVPCGAYAARSLAELSIQANVVTEERNVGSLTQKLLAGELDAAVIYATDVAAHPTDLRALPLRQPEGLDVAVWVGLVVDADPAAIRLYEVLRGSEVRDELLAAGFGP